MKSKSSRTVVLVVLVILAGTVLLNANGGKVKTVKYVANVSLGRDDTRQCEMLAEVNPVVFYLTSLNKKYLVLLIQVRNNTSVPFKLSKAQDKIDLLFDDQAISAVIDLPGNDPGSWDSLDANLRKRIVFPELVEPHEEEGIFVYVPSDRMKAFIRNQQMPHSIKVKVASIGREIILRRPIAAAKH
jgi:hypothetical protein